MRERVRVREREEQVTYSEEARLDRPDDISGQLQSSVIGGELRLSSGCTSDFECKCVCIFDYFRESLSKRSILCTQDHK